MEKDLIGLFHTISQVGIIVKDMDQFVKKMELFLGVKPVYVARMPNETMKDKRIFYHGELADCSAMLGFFRFGQLEVEAIQPLSGESIWQEYLDQKGEGIHHIRFSVDNIDAVDQHFEKLGIKRAQHGCSTRNIDGLEWVYYDTERALGFFVEVFNEFEDSGKTG